MSESDNAHLEKFNTVLRKMMSVSREEMQKREKAWKRNQARKKRAKTAPASRASADEG